MENIIIEITDSNKKAEYTNFVLRKLPEWFSNEESLQHYINTVHTGITIHLVDNDYDTGKIINQCTINVLDNDTVDTLSQRVLNKEHDFIVETLVKITNNEIIL